MQNSLQVKSITWCYLTILLILVLLFPIPASAESSANHYGAVHRAGLDPSPSNPGAEFGNDVAVSGDTLVVGARYDSVPLGKEPQSYSGAAYVYIKEGENWIQQARLTPSIPKAGDLFGSAVAIDRDTIVVGAVGNDSIDENGDDAPEMGAVYIFTRSGDQWQQQAKIEPEDGVKADYFGNSVAIAGERIVVGASGKDLGNTSDAGKVYTFYRSGTQWYQSQSITAPDLEANDNFGASLDIDGPRVVIGAPSDDRVGAAFIFYRTGSTWAQESKIEPDDDHLGDNFAASVSIEDELVVVGAPFADPEIGGRQVTNAGAAYVYRKRANTWSQDSKLVLENASAFDNFGGSVTTSGNSIVVGATGQDYFSMLRVGSAFTFVRNQDSWENQTQILSGAPYSDSNFGSSIAINGELIIVGEPGTSSKAGSIHVYSIEEGVLPETGFAPRTAPHPAVVQSPTASTLNSLQLEIPEIRIQAQVVSTPRRENSWNVQWLTNQVGHLEGTAYPTHIGNSVIAGHVNLPDGSTGPFAEISYLRWGDQIILQMDGHRYIYEVREVFDTSPTDMRILERDGDYAWLTLITCKDFDPVGEEYGLRTVVIAVRTE